MRVRLTRFRVGDGKRAVAQEWMDWIAGHRDNALETLAPERMYVESIFLERVDGVDHLWWYTVQGPGGRRVEDSEHWMDRRHLEYFRECVDDSVPPLELAPRVHLVQPHVSAAMVPLASSEVRGPEGRLG